MAVMSLKKRLNFDLDDDSMIIPYVVRVNCLDKLNDVSKTIKEIAMNNLKLVALVNHLF